MYLALSIFGVVLFVASLLLEKDNALASATPGALKSSSAVIAMRVTSVILVTIGLDAAVILTAAPVP